MNKNLLHTLDRAAQAKETVIESELDHKHMSTYGVSIGAYTRMPQGSCACEIHSANACREVEGRIPGATISQVQTPTGDINDAKL